MRVCIIGAGITGIVSCKYVKGAGLDVVVFEQSKNIGGTWVYTEETKVIDMPVHSSMYKNLLTNSPIEVMGFSDFEFHECVQSYVSWKEVLSFIESYVEYFELREYVKFQHNVKQVETVGDDKWRVTVQDLIEDREFTEIFDSVFVCNGHFSRPNIPDIKGIEYFKGITLHSHEYRFPEMFKGMKVLIIGSGPSGIDITYDLSPTAASVILSHHSTTLTAAFPTNVIQMPDVKEILVNGEILFENQRTESFDAIIYCTGYKYNFPFLSNNCGINVTNNHVTPLYKHMINIEHPTMFFIGVTNLTIFTYLIELQFCLKSLTNQIDLPLKCEMFEELSREIEDRHAKGYKGKKMHQLWPDYMRGYIDELVTEGKLTPIKPVLLDIYDESRALSYNDMENYRKYRYKRVSDQKYIKICMSNTHLQS